MKSSRSSDQPKLPVTLLPSDLLSIMEISKAMVSQPNMDKLLEIILAKVTEVIKAERSSLFLYNTRTAKLESIIAQKTNVKIIIAIGEGIAGYTAQQRKVIICPDTYDDPRFVKFFDKKTGYKTRNILSAPLLTSKGELIGVIEVLNKIKGRFAHYDITLIEAFASQATVAIQNAILFQENLRRKAQIERLNVRLTEKLETIEKELKVKYHYGNIIGQSEQMQQLYRLLEKVKETSFPILIQGGSGTGKELIARAMHFSGPRADEEFLSQNCAAIPETLLESELFGYVKGAFTGADRNKKGLFALADKGTLFLDEIGDMSLEMQKKLLRVLEDGKVRPVGGKEITKVDVRIITASNKNLANLMKEHKFRDDLFYRINVITINLPLLRERKEDIPLLVSHFLEMMAEETKTPKKTIAKEVMKAFLQYDWPGNIRELENEIKRMMVLAGPNIVLSDVSPHILDIVKQYMPIPKVETKPIDSGQSLKEDKKAWEKQRIIQSLIDNNWNITRAAETLGTSRPRLSAKMKQLGIKKPV